MKHPQPIQSTLTTAPSKPSLFKALPDTHLTTRERNIRDKVATDHYRTFTTCKGGDRA